MSEEANGGSQPKPKLTARKAFLGIGLGWGPGIVVAIVVGVLTKNVGFAVLAFAVVTAISAIVLGSVGSVLMKRREQRKRDRS